MAIVTEDSFRAFLAWLSPEKNPEKCPEKYPEKYEDGEAYEKARRRLVIFFSSRQCREPENLADKTIDIAILKIGQVPPEAQPIAYLIGIAKNVFQDYLRETGKEEIVKASNPTGYNASQPELEQKHVCLDRCLSELPKDERTILLNYYSQSKHAKIELHQQLADQCKLTPNGLRNRIYRLNKRMGRCINDCLKNLPA